MLHVLVMCLHNAIAEIWTGGAMGILLIYRLWPSFWKTTKNGAIMHTLIGNWSNQTICHMESTCPVHVPAYWYWWDINRGSMEVPLRYPLWPFLQKGQNTAKATVYIFIENWSDKTVCHVKDAHPALKKHHVVLSRYFYMKVPRILRHLIINNGVATLVQTLIRKRCPI